MGVGDKVRRKGGGRLQPHHLRLAAYATLAAGLCGVLAALRQYSTCSAAAAGAATLNPDPAAAAAQLGGVSEAEELANPLFQQIDRDLEPFKDGITLEMVEMVTCASSQNGFRLQVVDGQAWVSADEPGLEQRSRYMKLQIQHMLNQGWHVPDIDFFVVLFDGPDFPRPGHPCGPQGPQLTQGKVQEQWSGIMVPDTTFEDWREVGTSGWKFMRGVMRSAARRYPWDQKIPKVFFRGGTTSIARNVLFHSKSIQKRTELFDVKHTSPYDEALDYHSLAEHCKYKYLLHLGGNTFSSRIKWLAMCNSTIIFPKDRWKEFYYDSLLRDGVNIIIADAIEEDFTGVKALIQTVEELVADDARAQRLAMAASETMERELTPEIVTRYWHQLFVKYAALQKFEVKRYHEAIPLDQSIMHPQWGRFDAKCSCKKEKYEPPP